MATLKREVEKFAEGKKLEIETLKIRENYRKEFMGNVSHELKTPLFTVQGYTLTLLDGAMKYKTVRKKYLQRAAMNQSASTIPRDTWDYLLEGQPYRGPGNIVRRLKRAPKNVRKKCYDSLPILVRLLCPHINVPTLSEREKDNAMAAFFMLDLAYREGEPFVSYLYVLEYILTLIGRPDILPYINKISCKKRRAAYKQRLDLVFRNTRYRRA